MNALRDCLRMLLGVVLALLCLNALSPSMVSINYVLDPDLGFILGEGVCNWRIEGFGTSHWFKRGIRDNGIPHQAGPKVLILGDSMVEALQVGDLEAFPSIAQRELNSVGWEVQVLNAGGGGRSVADHVQLAPALLRLFEPAWTVVVVQDNDWEADAWSASKRHFVLGSGSELKVADGQTRVQNAIRKRLTRLLKLQPLDSVVELRAKRLAARWDEQAPPFLAGDGKANEAKAADPIEQEFELLKNAYPGRLSLLYLPQFPVLDNGPYASSLQSRIQRLCQQNDVDFIDFGQEFPYLRELGQHPQGFPNSSYGTGHFNSYGHQALARCLENRLKRLHQGGKL